MIINYLDYSLSIKNMLSANPRFLKTSNISSYLANQIFIESFEKSFEKVIQDSSEITIHYWTHSILRKPRWSVQKMSKNHQTTFFRIDSNNKFKLDHFLNILSRILKRHPDNWKIVKKLMIDYPDYLIFIIHLS